MKKRATIFGLLLCLIIITQRGSGVVAKESDLRASFSFFYYNSCASCDEAADFIDIIARTILPLKEKYPYDISYYNTFKSQDRGRYEQEIEQLGISDEEARLPFLLCNDSYASGYEEIENTIQSILQSSFMEEQVESTATKEKPITQGDNSLEASHISSVEAGIYYLFTTDSCKACETIKDYIKIGKSNKLVEEKSILEEENLTLLQNLFISFGVPSRDQQVPILFTIDGYAAGVEGIQQALAGEKIVVSSLKGRDNQSKGSFLKMFGMGMLNGINPCALSMLFFLLSILGGRNKGVLWPGIFYILGKWVAYCFMGLGIFSFLGQIQEKWVFVSKIFSAGMVAMAVILAIMNVMDYIFLKKKAYGKVLVQLPTTLRKWNHKMIRAMAKDGKSGKLLLVTVFMLSLVISAGEFFCTGQIYAASLFVLLKSMGLSVWLLFLIGSYVTALCIPSFVILIGIHKGGNLLQASDGLLQYLPVIKIIYSVVFVVFAIGMAYAW